jgi:mono/diheme cytochrome c family protein
MRIVSLVVLLLSGSFIVTAQDPAVKMKIVPVRSTPQSSGNEMFGAYCASCHGADAKGKGVAASALKVRPADLTLLAQHNGGKFPTLDVVSAIQDGALAAHGSQEMPVWGPILKSVSNGPIIVKQRIANITDYIESLQAK